MTLIHETYQKRCFVLPERFTKQLPFGYHSNKIFGFFRQRRIQDLNQRIIRLSRESLLSIASRFMAHFTGGEPGGVARGRRDSTAKQERQRLSMDPQSVLVSE